MQNSTSIINLAKALHQFQQVAEKVIKKADNPFFKSKYADLPSILDAIHPHLVACNLVVSQIPDGEGLTTILMHSESGEYICANSTMKPVKNDPQSIGSAITYHRRYALCSILNLNVDEDDDGNQSSAPKQEEGKQWLNVKPNTPEFTAAVNEYKQNGWKNIHAKYKVSNQTKQLIEQA